MNSQNEESEEDRAAEAAAAADAAADAAKDAEARSFEESLGDPDSEESPWAVEPEARIAELEAEVASVKDQYLRFMAEAENMRKRNERQLADAHRYGAADLARAVLTVADDLSRALAAVPEEQRQGDGLLQTLLGGVEAVERELAKALDTNNIERIDPAGEPFDPNFHEAMFEVPDSGFPSGTVAQVLQPGYRLHERLLRPARVGVAKGGDAEPQAHVDTMV